jgi:hypothetical protein
VCVCVYVCVSVSVSVSVCLSGYTFPHFSTDLLQIWREHSTGHTTLHRLYMLCVRACVHSELACVHSLIFERILSKYAGNILRLIISGNDYALFIFTHLKYARARVIKHALMHGRILFKFAVSVLQMPSSSMGYVLVMCASARVVKHSLIFGRILFKFAGHIL